uniref:Uncharacterized protein n=1 Tax=viral metagenome TaxID=1070528 RepID=A0A6M3JNH7_9ZZZZ
MRKPTLATLKKFARENHANLLIKVAGEFDGMTDGMEWNSNAEFSPIRQSDVDSRHTLGIAGCWLVLQSRDHIKPYESDTLKGFSVSNSCASFTLAVKKEAP